MRISRIFKERDPTRGSIVKESVKMSSYLWPNTLLWIIVNVFNLRWLSQIGIEAVAAVCIGSAAFMVLMTPIQGIITSTYGVVGSYKEDRVELEKRVKQILSTTWLTSLILAFFGWFFAFSLLRLLGAESGVISQASVYLQIQALGGIIAFSFWPINQMIRNIGKMGHGTIFMTTVLILQGIFDYLFILGNLGFPQWGVAGASFSRTLSAAIGAGVGFWWLRKITGLELKNLQDFKINLQILKEIIKIAGFDSIENFCRHATQMIMIRIIAPFGTLALGAYEIGQRFFRYCCMSVIDVAQTTANGCARNLGVGDVKRAKKWVWTNAGIAVLLMGIGGLVLFILAPKVIASFNQDPEVIAIGVSYLRITTLAGIAYVFFAIGMVVRRAFAAAKDTLTSMFTYFGMMALQIGLAIVLPAWLGINGIWWAIFAGMIFYGSVLAILFQIGYWKPKT